MSFMPAQPSMQISTQASEKRPIRGFELVPAQHRQHPTLDLRLPARATLQAAGYDFCTPVALHLAAGARARVVTDICAYMQPDEYLALYVRSSLGLRGLVLANTVGIVDSDYYHNPQNGGNIILALHNTASEPFEAEAGERIAQGIFCRYLLADHDLAGHDEMGEREKQAQQRTGGFGSTGSV